MRSILPWLLAACLPVAPVAWAADAGSRDERQMYELEKSIEQAREQLDEAARKLAKLHSRMWQMETTGDRAERPMLGVLIDDAGTDEGLALVGVTPEGGAEEAGLKAGDVIVSVNGVPLVDGDKKPMHRLSEAMSTVRAGEAVPVGYKRDGEIHEAQIRTRARGQYMAKVVEEKGPWLESLQSLAELEDLDALQGLQEMEILDGGKLNLSGNVMRVPAGLRLEDVSGDLAGYFGVDQGVLVLDSPSRSAALEPGDILLDIKGEAVTGADAALERLSGLDGEISARVKRRGREQSVSLDATALNADQAVHVVGDDRRIRIQRLGEGNDVRLEISVDD